MRLGQWDTSEVVRLDQETKVERTQPFDVFDPDSLGLANRLRKTVEVPVEGRRVLVGRNARLFGQRMLRIEDELFSDFQLDPGHIQRYVSGTFDVSARDHGLSIADDGNYDSALLTSPPVQVAGQSVLLTASEPMNYGAWLIRVLPKIRMARRVTQNTLRFVCFAPKPWQRSLLEWAGVDPADLLLQEFTSNYHLESALVPCWPSRNMYLHEDTVDLLRGLALAAARRNPEFSGPKAIYVSRIGWRKRQGAAGARYRPFAQEEELVEALAALGVCAFSPEEHDLDTVALTFENASLVIGPQGAGMFNAVFCRPGTTILDIEHLPQFLASHANLFASCGLRYGIIVGRAVDDEHSAHLTQKPLALDVPIVTAYVASVLESLP